MTNLKAAQKGEHAARSGSSSRMPQATSSGSLHNHHDGHGSDGYRQERIGLSLATAEIECERHYRQGQSVPPPATMPDDDADSLFVQRPPSPVWFPPRHGNFQLSPGHYVNSDLANHKVWQSSSRRRYRGPLDGPSMDQVALDRTHAAAYQGDTGSGMQSLETASVGAQFADYPQYGHGGGQQAAQGVDDDYEQPGACHHRRFPGECGVQGCLNNWQD